MSGLLFVAGPLDLKSAMARRDGFLQSTAEIGLASDPRMIVEGDHTAEGGMDAAAKLLQAPFKPTAILRSNGMTAIGAMRKGHEDGIEFHVICR